MDHPGQSFISHGSFAQPSEIAELLSAARAGEQAGFSSLSEPYRNELITYCYRMLGSLEDAEDIVQETFLRAWRRLDTYEGRAPFRAWLYKIATNACLDLLEGRSRRLLPPDRGPAAGPNETPEPPIQEPIWLEPFPDEQLAPDESSPEARYEAREAISLAFLTALQVLPPRQRAVLILRDVLDWSAKETASLIDASLPAVHSMLHRARRTLDERYERVERSAYRAAQPDEPTRLLLERYVRAWETADIDSLISLLREDASFPMPPIPTWYRGREAIRAFVSAVILGGQAPGRWRLLPVHANARPAFAWYRQDEAGGMYRAFAIQVLEIADGLVAEATTFGYPDLFPYFGLEQQLGSVPEDPGYR